MPINDNGNKGDDNCDDNNNGDDKIVTITTKMVTIVMMTTVCGSSGCAPSSIHLHGSQVPINDNGYKNDDNGDANNKDDDNCNYNNGTGFILFFLRPWVTDATKGHEGRSLKMKNV